MSVDFEGDNLNNGARRSFMSRSVLGNPQVPKMASWLMKLGIAKAESTAQAILLGIVALAVALTFVVYYVFVATPKVVVPPAPVKAKKVRIITATSTKAAASTAVSTSSSTKVTK
jgi:hypothetical protein